MILELRAYSSSVPTLRTYSAQSALTSRGSLPVEGASRTGAWTGGSAETISAVRSAPRSRRHSSNKASLSVDEGRHAPWTWLRAHGSRSNRCDAKLSRCRFTVQASAGSSCSTFFDAHEEVRVAYPGTEGHVVYLPQGRCCAGRRSAGFNLNSCSSARAPTIARCRAFT